jgi:hypothetical protein
MLPCYRTVEAVQSGGVPTLVFRSAEAIVRVLLCALAELSVLLVGSGALQV